MGFVLFVLLGGSACFTAILFVVEKSIQWEKMNLFLFIGTTALVVAAFIYAYYTISLKNTALFFVLSCLISLIAEYSGTRSDFPFGHRYMYHQDLQPMLFALIPTVIPLAWFLIGYTPLVFLKRYRIREDKSLHLYKCILKAALCALYMVGLDLFIDPLAVSVKAWTWEITGSYSGVPALNFMGWFQVGFIIQLVYFLFEKPDRDVQTKVPLAFELSFVLISITMTVIGFVTFVFRSGPQLVMLLPPLILVPFWVYWFVSIARFQKIKKGRKSLKDACVKQGCR